MASGKGAVHATTYLQNRIERVSGVRSDNQRGIRAAFLYQPPQVFSPDLLTGVVDVVAVADYGYGHAGKLLDDVLKGIFFMVLPPRRDGTAERTAEASLLYGRFRFPCGWWTTSVVGLSVVGLHEPIN